MIKDMDKQFNFEQVGKRMPYNVPDGFFDQLEQNVMAEVMADNTATDKPRQKARTLKIAIRTILAAPLLLRCSLSSQRICQATQPRPKTVSQT